MKQGIRVLGIDDAAFEHGENRTFLTGVVYRGTEFIEDIKTIEVKVDGEDATEKVLKLAEKFSNQEQIKALLLDGISLGGFNLVDLKHLSEKTGKPVIAVTKNRPHRERFRKTMEETGNYDKVFEKLGEPAEIELRDGRCFIQHKGCSREEASEYVRKNTTHGQIPESIRVADMIGRALPR
ncbi:MAG: DUF99 family protein [Candidatus Nanohaloarchaea archaeon]